jgi:peptidyl-lysine (3S)-dioxygenase / protease
MGQNTAWIIREIDGADQTLSPTWDPDLPRERATKFSHMSRPIRVTLDPGDMLYLPRIW